MNTIVHALTLLLIYIILSLNIKRKNVIQSYVSLIIILFISMIVSIFHFHNFIETIIISTTFAICIYTSTKKCNSNFIWLISNTFFLCSLRYSVHGFFNFKQQSSNYESLIASAVQILFLFLLHFSKKEDFQNQTDKEIIISSFIEVLTACTSFILIAGLEESRMTFYWIVSSIISFVMISFCILFYHLQKQDFILKEMKERELLLKLSKDQYDFACQKADKLSKYKHDTLHQWHTLYEFLENHEIENAKEYIESLTNDLNYEHSLHYSTNIHMDALLQYKVQQYLDVHFEIKMHIQKDNCDALTDFCLLLSHLIDYCKKIIDKKNLSKELTIHCLQKEKQILLEISTNSFNKTNKDSLPESINEMIRKNQGTIQEMIDNKYRIQASFVVK